MTLEIVAKDSADTGAESVDRVYQAPSLVAYGSLKAITAGGSGTVNEGVTDNSMSRQMA